MAHSLPKDCRRFLFYDECVEQNYGNVGNSLEKNNLGPEHVDRDVVRVTSVKECKSKYLENAGGGCTSLTVVPSVAACIGATARRTA
jgi:hypothetical protein